MIAGDSRRKESKKFGGRVPVLGQESRRVTGKEG